MRRAALSMLAVACAGLLLLAVPAVGATIVGTTTLVTDAESDAPDPMSRGEGVRARATVVSNLEPSRSSKDADEACPAEGCGYQLVLVDPGSLVSATETDATCETPDYVVVDASPDEQPVAGEAARVYTGQGSVPGETVSAGGDGADRLTPGVGQLCFAGPAHGDADGQNPGDAALAATQPAPIVVLYDPGAAADR